MNKVAYKWKFSDIIMVLLLGQHIDKSEIKFDFTFGHLVKLDRAHTNEYFIHYEFLIYFIAQSARVEFALISIGILFTKSI